MHTPSRSQPVPASIKRSKRIIRIVQSVPGASTAVSTYEAAVTSLERSYDAWTLARSQASVALANQHEAEAALDEEVRGVALAILKVGRGRRSSDIYHRYFPNGYGNALRLPPERALEVTSGILAQMEVETNAKILSLREDLVAAMSGLGSAITARQAAVNTLGQARALLQDVKLAWRKSYFDFYHDMRSLLFDRRPYVDSIFMVGNQTQPDEQTLAKTENAGSVPVPTGLTVIAGEAASNAADDVVAAAAPPERAATLEPNLAA